MSPTQDELFPDLLSIPPIARRIWAEIESYYSTATLVPLTQRIIAARLERRNPDLPCGLRTVQRAFHDYPLLLPWPVRRGQRPPWEPQPPEEELVDSAPITLQGADRLRLEAFDEHGDRYLIEARIGPDGILRVIADRIRRLTALIAATFAALVVLDGMDGHIDHAVHWCRIVAGSLPHLS